MFNINIEVVDCEAANQLLDSTRYLIKILLTFFRNFSGHVQNMIMSVCETLSDCTCVTSGFQPMVPFILVLLITLNLTLN